MDNENANNPDEKKSLTEDFDDSATADDINDSKVQFLNGGKKSLDDEGHVVVEVGSGSGSEVSFTGLGKEELMQYANDPFWVRIRRALLIIFWVGWCAMLVAAIVIIVVAPKCPERPDLKWYESKAVYKIDPKSYKDTSKPGDKTGAGIGDLAGISQKIGYLEELGLSSFWIRSFYESGGVYDGNDVVDHTKVDPVFGSMDAFKALRKETKKKAMKLTLDFIPNHTGKKHDWFVKSQQKEEGFEDFYIWKDCDQTNLPNNWKTVYGTDAWQYDDIRKQCYYFSYLSEYPDLNLRNVDVLANLDGVLKYWLDLGVDGFAVEGLQRLVEMNDTSMDEAEPGQYTTDQKENLDLVGRWRAIINSYSDKPGRERCLFGNVVAEKNVTESYYAAGIQVITSDALIDLETGCDTECMTTGLEETNSGKYRKGWMVDSENRPRFGSAVKNSLLKAFQAIHLLMPGTAVVYYGDEIAMGNGNVIGTEIKDPLANTSRKTSRDNYRTPMLWSSEDNAGFCAKNITPWLPVKDFKAKNVKFNAAYNVGYSPLKSFKDLLALREKESFQWGTLDLKMLNSDVMYFTRKAEGFPGYLVIINRGGPSSYDFSSIAEKMTLVYDSNAAVTESKTYDTKKANIAFKVEGEVSVYSY